MSGLIILAFIALFVGMGKAKDKMFYSDGE